MTREKLQISILLSAVVGLGIPLCLFMCFIVFILVSDKVPTPEPLSSEMKQFLCHALEGGNNDPLCENNSNALASDFVPKFNETFIVGKTTYAEIQQILDGSNLVEVENKVEMSWSFDVYDLSGDGESLIVFWYDRGALASIVFMGKSKLSPVTAETARYLCDNFDSEILCLSNETIYAQEFYPYIEQNFLGKASRSEVKALLSPFSYTSTIPKNQKLYFYFRDNVASQMVFYFDGKQVLENIAFTDVWDIAPLDTEIVSDLCDQFELSNNDVRCQHGAEIHSMDFASTIRDSFPEGIATYNDVQAKLGPYQYNFRWPIRDALGKETMLSWYDFTGSNHTRIRFDFDTNGILKNITFFVGFD